MVSKTPYPHPTTNWSTIEGVNEQDSGGGTRLHRAATWNRVNQVKALLKNTSLDPNIKDNEGFTALHRACKHANIEVINELLKDPRQKLDMKTEEGKTADELVEGIFKARLKTAKKQVKVSHRYVKQMIQEGEEQQKKSASQVTEEALHGRAMSDELARLRNENARLTSERDKLQKNYAQCLSAKDQTQRLLDLATRERSPRESPLVEPASPLKRMTGDQADNSNKGRFDNLQTARLKTEIRQLKIEQKILRASCASQKLELRKLRNQMRNAWKSPSASVLGENLPREIYGLNSARLSDTASALLRAQGQVLEAQKELEMCSVCLEFPKTSAIDPCGHRFCEECLNKNPTNLCFECRGRITKRLRLF